MGQDVLSQGVIGMDAMWMPDSPILRLWWLKRLSGGGGGEPVYKTISGNPVTFDAVAAPLQQLRVDFSPVQAGSGDPSPTNVRPISGWTGLTATVNGSAVPVSWESEAGTVYGGYVDLVSGELVAEWTSVIYDGSETWGVSYGVNFYTMAPATFVRPSSSQTLICNEVKSIDAAESLVNGTCKITGSGNVNFQIGKMIGISTVDDFKLWLKDHPIQICSALTTPIHYQLAPQAIRAITGSNTISSDGGTITVTYRES